MTYQICFQEENLSKDIGLIIVCTRYEEEDLQTMYGWECLSRTRLSQTEKKNPHRGVAFSNKVSIKIKQSKLLNLDCPKIS